MSSFGGTVKLTGENEYRKALKEISADLKVLTSEMKTVASQYDKGDKSVENLSAQNEILTKKITEQQKAVNILTEALEKSKTETGENSATTKEWQTKLNNAQAELNKLNRQVQTNTNDMNDSTDKTKVGASAFEKFGEAVEESGVKSLKLGDIIKANLISDAIIGGVKALANGIKAVGSAMFDFGKEVVNSFGELEQNLGGSEAVFGEYASKIQKTGEEAYKNLGVSQSQYLATANKMGALFQGSGIEQQKSLELTEQAMQRAADMASVMGIDMQTALDSVAGAAKGNFTMMDNLGVSMNATSIEAYAAAKGLDFVWASASQAEKTEMAMQMFFDNTTQYAGNFANESTQTLSGSFGLVNASIDSLVAGLGSSNADIVNLTGNVVDAVMSAVDNTVPIIENIIDSLPLVLNKLISAISEKLPELLRTGVRLLSSLLSGISQNIGTVMPVVLTVIQTLTQAILDNLPLVIGMGIELLVSLCQGIAEMLPELIPMAISCILTLTETLLDNIDLVIDSAILIIMALADGLIGALPELIDRAPTIIGKLVMAIIENLPKLFRLGGDLISKLGEGIGKAASQLGSMAMEIIEPLKSGLMNKLSKISEVGKELVTGIWSGIKDKTNWVLDKIKGFGDSIVNGIKDIFGIHSPSVLMRDMVGKNLAFGVGEGFVDTMADVTQEMTDAMPTEFDTDINTNIKGLTTTPLTYDTMLAVFVKALREVKVVMNGKEMGAFVTDTIEKVVYA